ncbi:MAG: SAM-dependent methyltransferase [Myxococcota bacterium]|jgi:SAM-dependent methyltransferase
MGLMDLMSLALHLWDRWRFEAPPQERAWDEARGVETSRWTLTGYEPTPLDIGLQALEVLPATGRTFVDVGCGKGRMLVLAAESGFPSVLGVELDSNLYDQARDNVGENKQIGVVLRDARLLPWPKGPLAIYLYNPFQEVVMGQMLDRLERSLRADPRPVDLVYVNPMCEHVFRGRGWRVLSDSGHGTTRWLHLRPDPFLCEPLRSPTPGLSQSP